MLQFSFIDLVYLFFAGLSLYFFNLFMILHYKNKKEIQNILKNKNTQFLSIIVPAHNEEGTIGQTLEKIKDLDWPKNKLEILVVDDGSTDKTREMARQYSGVKVITKKNGGKASALNLGVNLSKGDYVACIDADSYPEKDSVRQMMAFFQDKQVGAVTSSVLVREPKNLLQRLQAMEYAIISWNRKLFEFVEAVYVTPGPLSIYKKSALEKIGLFDEKCLTEDIEITWRLHRNNYKVRACVPAKVFTTVPQNIKSWWKQRLRWNIGGEQTLIKHGSSFFDKHKNRVKGFIAPFIFFSYLLSIIGLGLAVYVLGSSIYNTFLYHFVATISQVSLYEQLKVTVPTFIPNVFVIFGMAILLASIFFVNLGMKTMNSYKMYEFGLKNFANFLIYLTFYVTVFPIVLIHSLWRLVINKIKW